MFVDDVRGFKSQTSPASWAVQYIETVVVALQKRAVFKKTVKELSALSNYELNDLGIGRSEINFVAKQSVEGLI